MSEPLSPEAEAAGVAAAVAVEQAQEQQETREAAVEALIEARDAEAQSEIAQETAGEAAELAAVGAGVGMAAHESANVADAKAEEALSETAQLREEMRAGFGELKTSLDGLLDRLAPSQETAEVEEVTTDGTDTVRGNTAGESGNKQGTSDGGDSESSDRGPAARTRGFRSGRRR